MNDETANLLALMVIKFSKNEKAVVKAKLFVAGTPKVCKQMEFGI